MVMYILYLLTCYIAEQEKNSTRQNVEYDPVSVVMYLHTHGHLHRCSELT